MTTLILVLGLAASQSPPPRAAPPPGISQAANDRRDAISAVLTSGAKETLKQASHDLLVDLAATPEGTDAAPHARIILQRLFHGLTVPQLDVLCFFTLVEAGHDSADVDVLAKIMGTAADRLSPAEVHRLHHLLDDRKGYVTAIDRQLKAIAAVPNGVARDVKSAPDSAEPTGTTAGDPANGPGRAADPKTPAMLSAASSDDSPGEIKPTRNVVSALVHNLGDDIKHLPRRNSVYFLVGGGLAALAVHPADHTVNAHLLGSTVANDLFAPGKYVGSTQVQIGASIVTYIVGRASDKPRVRHIGMDLIEAQILAEGIVEGTKVIVQRHRPINPDGSSAPGYSFPSGHAAVTFATATVLQQHFGWKAAMPTYVLATYVATSRLHDNVHYLSDVVFGAATGIIIGRSVTWHGRNTFTIAMVPVNHGIGGVITW